MTNEVLNAEALRIGKFAYEALLEEVYTSPKPGLVDSSSSGAHKDMDVHTFEKSAKALWPYFVLMSQQGSYGVGSAKGLFEWIRKIGLIAEQAMYQVTNGINTHKGAIFTLGIYCAAAGRCLAEHGTIKEIYLRDIQIRMTKETLTKEIILLKQKSAVSHGEKNYHIYGTMGVRGEALGGYPCIWKVALPVFRQGIKEGRERNYIRLQTLLTLMCCTEDSNIIARHNLETLWKVKKDAEKILAKGGAYKKHNIKKLTEMDCEYTEKNISPGGCADLLAATIFLQKILG